VARARRGISVPTMPLFEAHRWRATLGVLEIDEIKTVPHVPMSHPFVERLIGTLRREFLDHVLFWNARDPERKLADFTTYYNAARVHAGLDGHTPSGFARGHPGARAQPNKVRWMSHCRGLVLAARGSVTKNSRRTGAGRVPAEKPQGSQESPENVGTFCHIDVYLGSQICSGSVMGAIAPMTRGRLPIS
jgi:hypothetical protein